MSKWAKKRQRMRDELEDFWSDFQTTLLEVCKEHTPSQVLALSIMSAAYLLITLVIAAVITFLLALIVMLLWNWSMTGLGLPALGYWKAWCLTFLSFLLVRGNTVHFHFKE
jgi:hypothetical protein